MRGAGILNRHKFTTKLIFYNLLLFSAILLVVVGVFYFWVVRDSKNRARDDFGAMAQRTAGQFDNLVYNMDKMALQIAANPNIVSWFGAIPTDTQGRYFIENPLIANSIVQLLNSYNFKRDGNTRICLYNDNGDFVYSATVMTTLGGIHNFLEGEEFASIQEHFLGEAAFSMLREPGPDMLNSSELPSPDYFSIVRQIKDYYYNTQKNGYVEVQQSVDRMDEIFGSLGTGCYAVVYNADGQIVYQSPAFAEQEKLLQTLEGLIPSELPHGVSQIDGDFVARYQTQDAPLDIIFYMETGTVLAPLNSFLILLVAVLCIVFAVAVFSERTLVTQLSRPLTELSRSVQDINIDNLHLELKDTAGSDELESLNSAFNKVLRHLEQAIQQRVLSQTNELKAHLFALQSQMNPHFIYNTLAIINMEAEINHNEKTVQICQALSKMLKYSTSMDHGMATLQQEMDHAGNYLALMKQRYEDSFEYSVQMEDSLAQQRVCKLMVQPICENCFKHAFSQMEGVWRIQVRAFVRDSGWYVTVEDNGCGVSQEFLQNFSRFKKNLSLESMQNQLHSTTLGGLSLQNTCMRLYLLYKDDFVFTIENTGHGTAVTIGGKLS